VPSWVRLGCAKPLIAEEKSRAIWHGKGPKTSGEEFRGRLKEIRPIFAGRRTPGGRGENKHVAKRVPKALCILGKRKESKWHLSKGLT